MIAQFKMTFHNWVFFSEQVTMAYHNINLRHAQMKQTSATSALLTHEPHIGIDNEVHIERAKYMLNIIEERKKQQDIPRLPRTHVDRKVTTTFPLIFFFVAFLCIFTTEISLFPNIFIQFIK